MVVFVKPYNQLVSSCVHRLIGNRADEAGHGELLSSADATPRAPVDTKPQGSWGPSDADIQAIARTHAGMPLAQRPGSRHPGSI